MTVFLAGANTCPSKTTVSVIQRKQIMHPSQNPVSYVVSVKRQVYPYHNKLNTHRLVLYYPIGSVLLSETEILYFLYLKIKPKSTIRFSVRKLHHQKIKNI